MFYEALKIVIFWSHNRLYNTQIMWGIIIIKDFSGLFKEMKDKFQCVFCLDTDKYIEVYFRTKRQDGSYGADNIT